MVKLAVEKLLVYCLLYYQDAIVTHTHFIDFCSLLVLPFWFLASLMSMRSVRSPVYLSSSQASRRPTVLADVNPD